MNRLVPIKTLDVDSVDNLTLCPIKVVRKKKKIFELKTVVKTLTTPFDEQLNTHISRFSDAFGIRSTSRK